MTRKEVLEQFDIDKNGVITDLGKFEGEMLYAPYFYNAVMHGDGERIADADFFEITEEDRTEFPELSDAYGVTLCESDQGFVYVRAHDRKAYEMLRQEAEKQDAQSVEE